MAGDRFRLDVRERERFGSPDSRRLRRQGLVPGVLYGKGAAKPFVVEGRLLRTALTGASGLHAVLDVVLEGQSGTHSAILKDYQRDPIRGHVQHVDLQEVRLDQPIQATVTVHLVGAEDAPGVREGGVLSAPVSTLNVEALPMEVPESIDADVSGMQIGDTLRLEDLPALEGVAFLDDPHETVVANVSAPIVEVEPEVEELEGVEAAAEGAEGEPGEAPEGGAPEAGAETTEA